MFFFCTGWLSFRLISISKLGIQPISSSPDQNDSHSLSHVVEATKMNHLEMAFFFFLHIPAQGELVLLIREARAPSYSIDQSGYCIHLA